MVIDGVFDAPAAGGIIFTAATVLDVTATADVQAGVPPWTGCTNCIPTICHARAPNDAPAALARSSRRRCSYSTVSLLSFRRQAFTATATWACRHGRLLTGKLPCDRERLELALQLTIPRPRNRDAPRAIATNHSRFNPP